jgi:hypothetical protein
MNILFLNHKIKNCGVYQYGLNLFNILTKSKNMNFIYKEIDSITEYYSILNEYPTINCILYNYHSATMGWLNIDNIQKNSKNIGLMHESHFNGFDYYIDIGNLDDYIPRPIFENIDEILINYSPSTTDIDEFINYKEDGVPIIGSFGFGFEFKGFDKIVKFVNEQYDSAIIKLFMTGSFFDCNSISNFEKIKNVCINENIKPNIKLMISRDFLTNEDLLLFLKSNIINMFLYDYLNGRGLSSVIDYALSVKKPIGISDSYMFRHIYSDEICIYKNTIQNIIDNTDKYREEIETKNSNEKLINKIETIIISLNSI